jgi:hypothetical protein
MGAGQPVTVMWYGCMRTVRAAVAGAVGPHRPLGPVPVHRRSACRHGGAVDRLDTGSIAQPRRNNGAVKEALRVWERVTLHARALTIGQRAKFHVGGLMVSL